MQLSHVIDLLQRVAPLDLAEPWDKVGLHAGDPAQAVRRAMLCIDLTQAVLAEAKRSKCNLVVAYHPPIFKPLDRVTTEDSKSRLIYDAVAAGIAIYSPHTALDAAEGGVNDWLASGLGKLADSQPITPTASREKGRYKIVTFAPQAAVDALRQAMAAAGAGRIGEYAACSFTQPGEGTFQGSESTRPAVGKAGRFERVAEVRLEMICPMDRLAGALTALREANPYEEPAIDVYRLEAEAARSTTGAGRVVTLAKPVLARTLLSRIKTHLGVKHLDVAPAPAPGSRRGSGSRSGKSAHGGRLIERVGVCAGAGGSLLEAAGPIDLYLTGEMRHHDVLAAAAAGTSIVLAGHTQTERPYLPVLRDRLRMMGGKSVTWTLSKTDVAPSAIV